MIALWVHLYDDIELDFERCIRPHKKVMAGHTVCPGSNFAYAELEALVRHYHDAWIRSAEAQQGITEFRQRQYVYAA